MPVGPLCLLCFFMLLLVVGLVAMSPLMIIGAGMLAWLMSIPVWRWVKS